MLLSVARSDSELKRAEELVGMDKQAAALNILYESIFYRRSRNAATENLEPVMLRLVELAVDLRRGKIVKDGLHQYKKLVVPSPVSSLETVIDTLLARSEEKAASAQAEADQIVDDYEDLENESPEDLLMSTVSSEQTKDRTDRKVLTPWLKFLWETYRTVLDVLRNNNKLEAIYAKVVSQAFNFCLKYQRKSEFRRLCELLRNHFKSAAQQVRQPNQVNPVDLTDPDTLQLYLNTRFEQLSAAVRLELWQEAFRSVEDVHTLLMVSTRPIKISDMATYYEALARIFAVSNNLLFHSAAWAKYYSMVYNTRHSAPEGELQRVASYFLLSILCIPNSEKEPVRNSRLTTLLSMSRPPTREGLIHSAISKNILNYARPEIRDLYLLIENDFNVLADKERLSIILESIGQRKIYSGYIQPLYDVISARIFSELAEIYSTVQIDFVIDMATLPEPFHLERVEIEKRLVLSSQRGNYTVRIDHQSGCVNFLDSLGHGEIGKNIRSKLADLFSTLVMATQEIDPAAKQQEEACHSRIVKAAETGLQAENEAFLVRREELEAKQLEAKKAALAREQEANRLRLQMLQNEREEEQRRLAEEQRRREIEREQKERAAMTEATKRKLAEEINAKGVIRLDLDKLDDINTEKLRQMQVEQLERENKDLRSRMKATAQRIDFFERAVRKEEAKLWMKDAEEQEKRDKEVWEKRKELILNSAQKQFEQEKEAKKRFAYMEKDLRKYIEMIDERRAKDYDARKEVAAKQLAEAKAQRIKELAERRAKEAAEAERQAKLAEERQERLAEEGRQAEIRSAELAARRKQTETKASPFGSARPVAETPRSVLHTATAGESRAATGSLRPASYASPFGQAKPIESTVQASPFGQAKPISSAGRASPFGNAKPVESAGRASPFGSAKPVEAAGRASPFGSAKPVEAAGRASPFGSAKPAESAGRASPFGSAKPAESAGRASPFGSAKPAESAGRASPFGSAKPVEPAGRASPFGSAKPVESPVSVRASLLADAKPAIDSFKATRQSRPADPVRTAKASPFGQAKPVDTPDPMKLAEEKSLETKPRRTAYVPPSRRTPKGTSKES